MENAGWECGVFIGVEGRPCSWRSAVLCGCSSGPPDARGEFKLSFGNLESGSGRLALALPLVRSGRKGQRRADPSNYIGNWNANRSFALFTSTQNSKTFQDFSSRRIFKCMY